MRSPYNTEYRTVVDANTAVMLFSMLYSFPLPPGLKHHKQPSYLNEFDNVYVSAVGMSFYSQCVPSNSVHLGFSAAAFHWLSER